MIFLFINEVHWNFPNIYINIFFKEVLNDVIV
jgi:hypothetical protein